MKLLSWLTLPLASLVGLAILGLADAGPARLHVGPWEFRLTDDVAEAPAEPAPEVSEVGASRFAAPPLAIHPEPHEGVEVRLRRHPSGALAVPALELEGMEDWIRGYFLHPSGCPEGTVRRPSFPGWSDEEILERIYRIEAARRPATVS